MPPKGSTLILDTYEDPFSQLVEFLQSLPNPEAPISIHEVDPSMTYKVRPYFTAFSKRQAVLILRILKDTLCEWEAWGPPEKYPMTYTKQDIIRMIAQLKAVLNVKHE
jgi:hypothetical protein